jgi:putative tryptophan/tyrosine transport system substrate-binding protein
MRRREAIALLGGALVTTLDRARAQQERGRVARIGFISLAPESAWSEPIAALRSGLAELGHVEGKNLVIEFRWADDVSVMPKLAAELVAAKVDVIVAPASTEVEPARAATKTIPIVFAQHADPVGMGDVASLAHPGGNVTGVSMLLTEVSVKGMELLLQSVSAVSRLGVLLNPTTPTHMRVLDALQDAAVKLKVDLVVARVQTVSDFEPGFATIAQSKAGCFIVPSSPLTNVQRSPLAALATRYKLPGMFANKANVEAGGLMSYGADFNYMYRRAAFYVDRLLRGDNPANLPVEQASKYQFVINLKTATTLGLQIPPTVLGLADEVIE